MRDKFLPGGIIVSARRRRVTAKLKENGTRKLLTGRPRRRSVRPTVMNSAP